MMKMEEGLPRILESLNRDEALSSEALLPLVYDELRHLAAQRLSGEAPGQTLQPTALVHEAWLQLTDKGDRSWNDRAHFFRAAAQAMRRILVDKARAKSAVKRGEGIKPVEADVPNPGASSRDDRVLMIDEMLGRLESDDPESARVVTLKFFGGLTNLEVAEIQGVTERTVERQWAFAKACLFQMIQEDME